MVLLRMALLVVGVGLRYVGEDAWFVLAGLVVVPVLVVGLLAIACTGFAMVV